MSWIARTLNALRPRLPHADCRRLELLGQLGLAIFCGTPKRVVDDAQRRDICSDPFGLGVRPRDALAGTWIPDVPLAVPHENASIELVVEVYQELAASSAASVVVRNLRVRSALPAGKHRRPP